MTEVITMINKKSRNARAVALSLSMLSMAEQNRRKDAINAVLILTDGQDSGSQIKIYQLEQELQKTGFDSDYRIGFFTVGYGNSGEFNPQVLQKIAEANGGYYKKGDPETISSLMSDLQVEF